LAKRGSQIVYSTIPKFREWLIVNCIVNDVGSILMGFYIFRGERLHDDYIQKCKLGHMYGNVDKGVDDKFPFQRIPFIFQTFCSKWDLPNQSSIISSRWSRITCYIKSLITRNGFWFIHDNPTLAHLTCIPTP
jgi:hypothetical protein